MKRLLISIGGGLLIPVLLLAFAALVWELLEMVGMRWAVELLFYTFLWPLKIWTTVFPHSFSSCGPTEEAIIATIITDFLFYSSLTHLVQMIIARIRRKVIRSLSEDSA